MKEEKKESISKAKRFIPPTLAEVQAYCSERGNIVNAEQWHDYYSSKGWLVGKTPMKDWKASVRTWERNSYSQSVKQVVAAKSPAPYYNPFDDPSL